MKYIYIIKCREYTSLGISHDPVKRLSKMQVNNPYDCELIISYPVKVALADTQILKLVSMHKHRSIWYNATPSQLIEIIEPIMSMRPIEIENLKNSLKSKSTEKTKDREILSTREVIKNSSLSGEIEITEVILKSMMTRGWGMPASKAKRLGIKYPLSKGWQKKIIGKRIPMELCKDLLSNL